MTRLRWVALALALRLTAPLWFVVAVVDTKRLFSPRAIALDAWTAAPGRRLRAFSPAPSVTVRGYELAAANGRPRGYAIFFHGSAGRARDDLPFLAWLRSGAGLDVSDYDFRGCGFSSGTGAVADVWSDALREYDDVHRRAVAARVPTFVYGYSLGSALATYVARARRPDGVVLQSAPYDLPSEIAFVTEPYRLLLDVSGAHPWVAPDAADFFDNARRIRDVREPLLAIHGSADRLVGIGEGRALYGLAASRDKTFVAIPGLDHLGWIPPTAGGRAVRAFVARIARRHASRG